jgi:hypothetical protein
MLIFTRLCFHFSVATLSAPAQIMSTATTRMTSSSVVWPVKALCADSFEPSAFAARHSAASARRRQARRYNLWIVRSLAPPNSNWAELNAERLIMLSRMEQTEEGIAHW